MGCRASRNRNEEPLLRVPLEEGFEGFQHRSLAAETVIAAVDQLSAPEDLQIPIPVRIHELHRGDAGTRTVGLEGCAPSAVPGPDDRQGGGEGTESSGD